MWATRARALWVRLARPHGCRPQCPEVKGRGRPPHDPGSRHRSGGARASSPPVGQPAGRHADVADGDRSSIRARVVAPVAQAARDEFAGTGEPLPACVTPHTFRRSTATYWDWLGRGERDTMHEIGHRASRLTLEVYAQARPREPQQPELLERWMQGVELREASRSAHTNWTRPCPSGSACAVVTVSSSRSAGAASPPSRRRWWARGNAACC